MSRQSIYQRRRQERVLSGQHEHVLTLVAGIRLRMPRLGTRKLYHLLKPALDQAGIKLGRDALFALLRSEGLLIRPRKRYTKTTHSRHWLRKYPNLLPSVRLNGPEQCFVSDITYIKSRQCTHYLSLVTDAYSRKIMGFHLSDDMEAETVGKALEMTIGRRITSQPAIHHSDRGVQYCSSYYQGLLASNRIRPSMTDGYDCYQNALAERINGILKDEFLFTLCGNRQELEELVAESVYIYNNERPHLRLHMQTPNQVHKKTGKESVPR